MGDFIHEWSIFLVILSLYNLLFQSDVGALHDLV